VLVFDLDETLIHTLPSKRNDEADKLVEVKRLHEDMLQVGFKIRPGYLEIISQLKPLYNLVIMTSSVECYAEAVYKAIDPKKSIFQLMLAKGHCINYSGKMVKDLRIFEGVPLADIIIVDNFAYAYCLQQDNGIPILPYYAQEEDFELFGLAEFLIKLSTVKDVREIVKQQFYNETINKNKNILEYLEKLRQALGN